MKRISDMSFNERHEAANEAVKKLRKWRSKNFSNLLENIKPAQGLDGPSQPEFEALKKDFYRNVELIKKKYFSDMSPEEEGKMQQYLQELKARKETDG